MEDYAEKKNELKAEEEKHCKKAKLFAGLNASMVITTAVLAAVAAVTSQTEMPKWVTTVAAGLSAALAIITAKFNFQEKSSANQEVAGDLRRLEGRYDQLINWHGPTLDGQDWLNNLGRIEAELFKDRPVPDETLWAAARVPAPPTS